MSLEQARAHLEEEFDFRGELERKRRFLGLDRLLAAALLAARGRGEPNADAAAFLDLEKWAESSVLSPEQRSGYRELKLQNKRRSLGV